MIKVHYEVSIRSSKAAYCRLGEVIANYGVEVTRAYRFSDTVILLLKMRPEVMEAVKITLVPWTWEYRSPTHFKNGTILPVYQTAEEEVAAIEKEPNDNTTAT